MKIHLTNVKVLVPQRPLKILDAENLAQELFEYSAKQIFDNSHLCRL